MDLLGSQHISNTFSPESNKPKRGKVCWQLVPRCNISACMSLLATERGAWRDGGVLTRYRLDVFGFMHSRLYVGRGVHVDLPFVSGSLVSQLYQ